MRLHAGAVHIWQADLDGAGDQIVGLLSMAERERAARIVREPVRRRWSAARGALRLLLGAYLGEHPSTLPLTREQGDKPMLELPDSGGLHFNLSHSGGMAVYAFTEMCDVGIDVELVHRSPSVDPHPPDFLRAWVRREAEGKRTGFGVRNTLVQAQTVQTGPWIADLDLGDGAFGAIALVTKPVDFRVYPLDFRAYGSILPASPAKPNATAANTN